MSEAKIAVIGGGMAGLTCARELELANVEVTVFEKSRGLGGRLATRRQEGLAFDHGAQFITARSRPFLRHMESVSGAGHAHHWRPSVAEDTRHWDAPFEEWLVGTPGMSAVVRPLTRLSRIRRGITVHELFRTGDGWQLHTDAGREEKHFDAVAVAVPAPQALTLLAPHAPVFRHIGRVGMTPCWSTMVRFDKPPSTIAEAHRWTAGPLRWAACDSSKPGRAHDLHCWVLHASAEWSQQHLDADAQEAAHLLLREFSVALDRSLPAPVFLRAHRWRYAQVDRPLGMPCLFDSETAAGACGDWCIAPRVEAAFDSGRTLAHSLLSTLGLATPLPGN